MRCRRWCTEAQRQWERCTPMLPLRPHRTGVWAQSESFLKSSPTPRVVRTVKSGGAVGDARGGDASRGRFGSAGGAFPDTYSAPIAFPPIYSVHADTGRGQAHRAHPQDCPSLRSATTGSARPIEAAGCVPLPHWPHTVCKLGEYCTRPKPHPLIKSTERGPHTVELSN